MERALYLRTGLLASLVAAASALGGCAAQQSYRTGFEGTRGALDAVRRSGPDAVDPEAVRAVTAAATEGARTGLGLPEDLDAWAAGAARHAAAGAVMGVGDGITGGLGPALQATVDALANRLTGTPGHPGVVAAVIDDAQPGIERLTRAELLLLRAQWNAMLRETRVELSGTTRDLDANLQAAVRANGDALGVALRDRVMPAVSQGLTRDLAPAAEELSRRAALGASRGLAQGLRSGLTPAVTELREKVVHGEDHDNTILWVLVGIIGVLMVALGFVITVGWKSVKQYLKPMRVTGFGARARPALGRAVRAARRPPRKKP